MRVSVDEAWQDSGVAQINGLDGEGVDHRQRCLAAPERPNAPGVNEDPRADGDTSRPPEISRYAARSAAEKKARLTGH